MGRLRSFGKSTALRSISIIAITSQTLDGEEQTTRAAGCDSYMPEPYSSRQLLAKKFSSACPNSCDRLLHRVMSLLAQSGHHDRRYLCPLSGVRRTSPEHALMSAFDPKRTSARPSAANFNRYDAAVCAATRRREASAAGASRPLPANRSERAWRRAQWVARQRRHQ